MEGSGDSQFEIAQVCRDCERPLGGLHSWLVFAPVVPVVTEVVVDPAESPPVTEGLSELFCLAKVVEYRPTHLQLAECVSKIEAQIDGLLQRLPRLAEVRDHASRFLP